MVQFTLPKRWLAFFSLGRAFFGTWASVMVPSILLSTPYTVSGETQLKLTHLCAHQKNLSANWLSERWRAPWEFDHSQQQRERRKHLVFKADSIHLQLNHRKLRDREWKMDRTREKKREFAVFDVKPHSRGCLNPSDDSPFITAALAPPVTMATRACMVDWSWRVWIERERQGRESLTAARYPEAYRDPTSWHRVTSTFQLPPSIYLMPFLEGETKQSLLNTKRARANFSQLLHDWNVLQHQRGDVWGLSLLCARARRMNKSFVNVSVGTS